MAATDLISAICSVIGAVVALITLLTVYVAALQVLSDRRIYRLGLSRQTLGPWKSKVVKRSMFGLQSKITTPTLNLPTLVKERWSPTISFPTGFHKRPEGIKWVGSDPEMALAKASWVNFMQSLGLSPKGKQHYEMQIEPGLVNGIVPMRWKGKDLVGICSMLAFQSHEPRPSAKSPMPLPMQWSGPLGWLQFRSSPDGCVVEYRRRMHMPNQLSKELHNHYQSKGTPTLFLVHRLWQSIQGLCLKDGRVLYLGGADKGVAEEGDAVEEGGAGDGEAKSPTEHAGDKEASDRHAIAVDSLLEDIKTQDFSEEDLKARLWGIKPEGAEAQATGDAETDGMLKQLRELRDMIRKVDLKGKNRSGKKEVLKRCPGLLSVVVQGELAFSRGLDLTPSKCVELWRIYTEEDKVDKSAHPYSLGGLCMDRDLLGYMKEALLLLKPDGFYFGPSPVLALDVDDVYQHVKDQFEKLDHLFPTTTDTDWPGNQEELYRATTFCNELQRLRKAERTVFTIDDMAIMSNASLSLRKFLRDTGTELTWAMIVCPRLFHDLVQYYGAMQAPQDLVATLPLPIWSLTEVLDCTALVMSNADPEKLEEKKYMVPLVSNNEFNGAQLLAAFMDVCLTVYWIEKSWITDVSKYDATIPQSVIMF
ncbi:hypothetical protein EG329_000543 [Mollisiaceae sp. DMI_Dod_QoI]|nr:hypothetical protein EG329_000543 [Helotiales sp. DMI_Dod_QoI]